MKAAHAAGCTRWSPSWGHMFDDTTAADQVLSKPWDVIEMLDPH
jgi:hypothetical protein